MSVSVSPTLLKTCTIGLPPLGLSIAWLNKKKLCPDKDMEEAGGEMLVWSGASLIHFCGIGLCWTYLFADSADWTGPAAVNIDTDRGLFKQGPGTD